MSYTNIQRLYGRNAKNLLRSGLCFLLASQSVFAQSEPEGNRSNPIEATGGLLANLSARKEKKLAKLAKPLLEQLRSISLPGQPSDWNTIKAVILESEAFIADSRKEYLSTKNGNESFRSTTLDEVNEILNNVKSILTASASTSIGIAIESKALEPSNFFENYPIAISRPDMVVADYAFMNFDSLTSGTLINLATAAQSASPGLDYGKSGYLRLVFEKQLEENPDAPLEALKKFVDGLVTHGFKSEVPIDEVLIVMEPYPQGSVDFTLEVENDLPIAMMSPLEFDALAGLKAQKLIVFIQAVATEISNSEPQSVTRDSQYISGTKSVENPDYENALEEFEDAQKKLRAAEHEMELADAQSSGVNSALQTSSVSNFGTEMVVTVMQGVSNIRIQNARSDLRHASKNLEDAQQYLEETPKEIEEKAYVDYLIPGVKMQISRDTIFAATLLQCATLNKSEYAGLARENREFTLLAEAHPLDPNGDTHRMGQDSTQAIRTWASEVCRIPLSSIIANLK